MAKIRVDQIGNYVQNRLEALLRAAVLETDSLLKQASPVDTGRFRASWQVGENAAPGGIAPSGSYPGVTAIKRLGYQREKVGNIYSVHNNLPYAEPLAGGSYPPSWGGQYRSKQAEPGWVQGVAKDVQGRIIKAAAGIGRTYTRNRQ
jgi:hypothetical protein